MKIRFSLPLVSIAFAALAVAQDMPTPGKEVSGLARFAGHFEGSGHFVMSAGGKAFDWTATEVTEPVLGGFAYQTKSTTKLGSFSPAPYELETLSTFDAQTNEFVRMLADTNGSGDVVLLHWAGPDTLVATTQIVMHGTLIREQSVARLTEDGYDVRLLWTIDDGEPFEHSVGSYKRVEPDTNRPAAAAPKTAGMVKVMERFVGTWESSGWVIPAPGMDKLEITSKQVVAPILGGSVLREMVTGRAQGMPLDYEALSYIYHDPVAQCFRHFGVSNHGEVGRSKGWVLDNGSFCFMTSGSAMGVPIASRTLMEFDDQGPLRMTSDRLEADGEAARVFLLDFKRGE